MRSFTILLKIRAWWQAYKTDHPLVLAIFNVVYAVAEVARIVESADMSMATFSFPIAGAGQRFLSCFVLGPAVVKTYAAKR